ncbi:MAG: shikimate kinase [Bacteroidales bacterium]|jgi:shikimate kinase|nr:shikimate kinase [Bacteroidales bacterium]MCK9497986.1 shikimate kinase [Bacteroidales bacterium]MDY0315906.1 shikimate kinase [Bacteroidales bacterium]NLB86546.1 shikimate kinase [Bacteroidales bacterium]
MKILLLGFMSSGKSVFGKKLASALKLEFYDLDKLIEEKYKISIPSIFSYFDESIFRNLESITLKEFENKNNFLLSLGGGTPCFNNNLEIIKKLGTSIYIKLDAKSLTHRLINSKTKRPLITNLSEQELLHKVETMLIERENYYSQADLIVNGFNLKLEYVLSKLFDIEYGEM